MPAHDPSSITMYSKRCGHCKRMRRKTNFYFSSRAKNNLCCWCKKCCKELQIAQRPIYLPKKNASARRVRAALRLEVLRYYSRKKKPECACCHIKILEFLGIDHIKGGGVKHKKLVRHVYKWLKKNGFPKGFRVLCHNCNQSIGAYGYCPHNRS